MQEVVETDVLQMLEENYQKAKDEIRELDLSALVALKSLNDKTSSGDFNIEQYRDLKKKLQARLPILEQKYLAERIRDLQARREALKKELADIQPEQVKTKANVVKAEQLLREAAEAHNKLNFKAASIENLLAISFEELRISQRRSQELIKSLTGLAHDDGPSATAQNNLLIRGEI
jgi:chromosome segregation ATPase